MPGSMFLWGILALLQMAILPGYLIMRSLRLRGGIVENLLLTFGLSTLFNYLLVTLLVSIHSYGYRTMLWIIGIEIVCWLILWGRDRNSASWVRSGAIYRPAAESWEKFTSLERSVVALAISLGLFGIFSLIYQASSNWQDGAFILWDNVFSWNRWATEWAQNRQPFHTFRYPQLITSNWSIPYLLMGNRTVEAFSKFFFVFFPLGILIAACDLGVRRRQIGYFIGAFLIYLAYMFMAPPGPAEGYADVPVTFMIVMSLYCMLMTHEQRDSKYAIRWTLLAGVFAGAALQTKQTGFYLFGSLPFLLVLLIARTPFRSPQQRKKAIIWSCVMAFAIGIPWYLWKEYQIHTGKDLSEIYGAQLAMSQKGHGILEHLAYVTGIIMYSWGYVQPFLVAALALVCIFIDRTWRWVIAWLFIPGMIIWCATTSYDLRNSTFAVTLGCIGAGLTIEWLLQKWRDAMRERSLFVQRGSVALGCVAIVFGISFVPSVKQQELIARSEAAQRNIAMPEVNQTIYKMIQQRKITKPIVTNYFIMPFIPGLRDYIKYDSFDDPAELDKTLILAKPQYILVVHPSAEYPAMKSALIEKNVASGRYSIAERGGQFILLEYHDPPLLPSGRSRDVPFKFVSGITEEEGPYPQWNLPIVQWGLGPATKLTFEAESNEPMQLWIDVVQATADQKIQITLNGKVVAQKLQITAPFPKELKIDLQPKAGLNEVEITYSTWGSKTETRPVAMLYSSLKIVRK